MYADKMSVEQAYENAKRQINTQEPSTLNIHNALQSLAASLNIGHTSLDFPVATYLEYASTGGLIFPLEIAFEENKALVRRNHSKIKTIAIGTEVISINGMAMKDVLQKISALVSAETPYFKNTKIELFTLPRYYWQAFGAVDTFTVEIDNGHGQKSYSLAGINAMGDYEKVRTDIINNQTMVKYFEDIAYLNPGSFGGDEGIYRQFIDDAFADIISKDIQTLIIDLRNNSGGDDSFSDYMVAYIADRPFQWSSHFSLKTSPVLKENTQANFDMENPYFKAIMDHPDGAIYDYKLNDYQPQPPEKRFKGKVFVLINRQSHSQSTVTAAQIKDYGWGTLVGEETAEFPSLQASQFSFTLPHSGTTVRLSKGYIVRINGDRAHQGLKPDMIIKDHLLDEKDEILEGLLSHLKESKKN